MKRTRAGSRGRLHGAASFSAEAGGAVPPTPETRARLRHDVIGRLVAGQRLDPVHARAAAEIRAVAEAAERGMVPTALLAAWTAQPVAQRRPRDFLDRMSAAERRLWQRVYLPWTRDMLRAGGDGLAGPRRLRLVLDIVVDNCGLRAAERRHGLRHGAALGRLAAGLERFAHRRRRAARGGPPAGFG